ncbi:MAG TPA: Gfo/Idh/MocA family oxidoreductase [Solirubrobacteraceae bacterium]|nr:Gfo/Idh/MocA family oxidoreductase [Solirubrobacteraceae bacterium]
MSKPIRVGVVGCGLIAQVMHLPYLSELADQFEIAAVCDVSEPVARQCADRYDVPAVHTNWQDLLGDELDAVMVLTSGSHAPIAIQAAQTGRHVFVEKPMALSSADCEAMVHAAESAGVRLMVGTMKRYDPAYERLGELIGDVRADLRLARVTTLESPFGPYVSHYPLVAAEPAPADVIAELEQADERTLDSALGDADEQTRWCYRWILLDNLVHEFNALRGVLGEPTDVVSANLSPTCVNVNLGFGETQCHLSWVDLPGIARYKQEFAFYAPEQRLTLELPSPFLRNMPSRLFVEGGDPGTTHSWERAEIVSYDEAFKRELVEFADCIATGREPRTSGHDGLADLRLCEAVARAHQGLDPGLATETAISGGVGSRS